MNVTQKYANDVFNDLKANGLTAVPIDIITTIITAIFQLFQSCKKPTPAQLVARAQNPGFVDQLRINRVVRQRIRDPHIAEEVHAALRDRAAKMTTTEAKGLLSEN